MIYCDTSLLISALVTEPRSTETQAWLGRQPSGGIAISAWVDTEFASAIAIKSRTGAIDDETRSRILTAWRGMMGNLHIEPIRTSDFATATLLVNRPGSILRGGDALHLAIAMDRGFDLATLDVALADEAVIAGINVHRMLG